MDGSLLRGCRGGVRTNFTMYSIRSFTSLAPSDIQDPPAPSSSFDDLPVDQKSCSLLGPTALVVQALMGVLVILSLVYKRHREKPMRPWRIWLFDVSKQVFGQMFIHGVNVFISDFGAHHISGNACVYYFLNILIDTTFGVGVIYLILHVLTNILSEKLGLSGFESGQYGSPPSLNYWARQAAVYVLSLTTMKIVVVGLFALWPGIVEVGAWLLSWLGSENAVQVIFVMGLFPIMMNILQFWLIDSIVKASSSTLLLPTSSEQPRASHDQSNEPLFRASSDDSDDDDDDHHGRRHDIENPPRSSRSRSPSHDPSKAVAPSTPTEYKSTGGGSGSVTPRPADFEGQPGDAEHEYNYEGEEGPSRSLNKHAYPPSLISSSNSPSSSRPTSVSPPPSQSISHMHVHSQGYKPKRRSPPAPLRPRSPLQPALNSPLPTAEQGRSVRFSLERISGKENPTGHVRGSEEKDWDAWDENDDWAERVGEDVWGGSTAPGVVRT
ncbi:hypothetical protein JAAARDRAFT_28080 [Jaapia argillacea MUCL 33604]|uniref:Vacuolar membrane protein n=1 Tax=Jaapia argillacea MUCL 33604 TaxID=933084 RepID=A0A067QE88_9AGAM|nr:hypothetical protein JAAARDRAFT_28080 [Jaapia argillacea MUCL 33604]